MTQGFGYLIAAIGPIAIGLVNQHSKSWTLAYALLAGAVVIQLFIGLKAARPRSGEVDHRELSNV